MHFFHFLFPPLRKFHKWQWQTHLIFLLKNCHHKNQHYAAEKETGIIKTLQTDIRFLSKKISTKKLYSFTFSLFPNLQAQIFPNPIKPIISFSSSLIRRQHPFFLLKTDNSTLQTPFATSRLQQKKSTSNFYFPHGQTFKILNAHKTQKPSQATVYNIIYNSQVEKT